MPTVDQLQSECRLRTRDVATCRALDCRIVAEGVETVEEYRALRAMGIGLVQGYLLARPQVEALPHVEASLWDLLEGSAA